MIRLFIISILIHIVKPQAAHQISDANGVVTTVFIRDANGLVLGQPTAKKDDFGRSLPDQSGSICSSLNSRTCDFLQGDVPKVTRSPRPLTKKWLKNLDVGDRVDALDYTNHWFTAEVVQRKRDSGKNSYKIHFDGWEEKWDEWIAWDAGRLNKENSKARGGRVQGGVSGSKYLVDNLPETYKDKIPPQKKPKKNNILKNLTKKKASSTATTNKKKDDKKDTSSTIKNKLPKAPKFGSRKSTSTSRTTTTTRKAGQKGTASTSTTTTTTTQTKKEKKFVSKKMEEFLNMLAVGHQVDALDSYGYWYTARIIKVDSQNRILIKFDEWEDKWNEWIERFSGRLAKHRSIAKGGQSVGGVKHPQQKVFVS